MATTRRSPSSTVTSARAPATRRPRSARPSRSAGVDVTVATASGTEHPVNATRLRTASSSDRTLPASTPSALRTPSAPTVTSTAPSRAAPALDAERRDGVGDEVQPVGPSARHAIRTATGSTWMPSQISPTTTVVVGERGADRAGVAVGERPHGVEQVGDVARAGGDGGGELGGACQSVWPIDTTTPRPTSAAMTSSGAGQLGGERSPARRRHPADQPSISSALGRGEEVRGMGAPARRRQHRPLEVQAERHGARTPGGIASRPRRQRRPAHRLGARDHRRHERRHAVARRAPRRARRCAPARSSRRCRGRR